MPEKFLYLSRADIQALGISAREARLAVGNAFHDYANGLNTTIPKAALVFGAGRLCQAMVAASEKDDLAVLKWLGVAPVPPGISLQSVYSTICVNRCSTGLPLAIFDGDEITLLRTAAMSAFAASKLAPVNPKTIGFVGCGVQASAHLAAFCDLFPSLKRLMALSRSRSSAEKLVHEAQQKGLEADVMCDADTLLRVSDIVISSVPGGVGQPSFLDARLLKSDCFVAAVDAGRSWFSETLPAFDLCVTDSLTQSKAPHDCHGKDVSSVIYGNDLAGLSVQSGAVQNGRNLFSFRGFAIGDLALASLVMKTIGKNKTGIVLDR